MLLMGAEERDSPAASQLERHVNQYIKARSICLGSMSVRLLTDQDQAVPCSWWAVAHAGLCSAIAAA